MKLCYLSNSNIPSRAANSVHVMHMCQAFAELGHEVTLFAGQGGPIDEDVFSYYGVSRSFSLIRLPRPRVPFLKSFVYARSVARQLAKHESVDLVYARDPFALYAAQQLSCPLVYEAHVGPGRLRRIIEHRIFRRDNFSHLVVISNALKSTYAALFPPHDTPLRMVVAHDAATDAGDVEPAKLKARAGAMQIGYTGHLYRGRGMELIECLAKRLTQHDFHIVGGTEQDLAHYRASASSLPNLTLHGYVPPREVASYRAAMDVLIAPYQTSISDAGGDEISQWISPLKIFEYMSAAKAIVASDIPVLRETLTDRGNCLLVEPKSIDDWCAALTCLDDSLLRTKLGDAARRDFEQRYTWTARARAVLAGIHVEGGQP